MRDGAAGDVRAIEDVRALAALAHRDRARLLDALAVHGPSTTSALADALALATGSVSHHLKVLVDAGLVAPAPDQGSDRRKRHWQLVTRGMTWSATTFAGDPAGEAAATAAEAVLLARDLERAREHLATAGEPWQAVALSTHSWLRLTPDELDTFRQQVEALVLEWRRRDVPDDGAPRQPVRAVMLAFPSDP
jgi:DNA-binding transcriptional ArsR family regulator